MAIVHLSSDPPKAPTDADFALYIEFERGVGNPSRIFQTADKMIRALQDLDHALAASVDNHIEPVLVLEDLEVGSLKIWLRNILHAADDDALKTLDWKPAVGKYLVRAKYAYIEWANKTGPDASLLGLTRRLAAIASETDVKHLPDYAPPSVRTLADIAEEIDSAKSLLLPSDKITYLPGPAVALPALPFDLRVRFSPQELVDYATKDRHTFNNMPMNLIVKKPDYLGNSMWEFRHGKTPLWARIEDAEWLRKFQNRGEDVRPGDALKCLVTVERRYGFDNELIDETYTITKVEAVLPNQIRQDDLPFGNGGTPTRL